jgi:hypothetical protein
MMDRQFQLLIDPPSASPDHLEYKLAGVFPIDLTVAASQVADRTENRGPVVRNNYPELVVVCPVADKLK